MSHQGRRAHPPNGLALELFWRISENARSTTFVNKSKKEGRDCLLAPALGYCPSPGGWPTVQSTILR